jgi:phenylacetic acid degradation operon negative regulatory protein
VTILGDSIAPRGGAITLGSLIRLAQPFGITERLVRTSVGRLAQDGWLESQRSGRQSEYKLTDEGRTRFAEATQKIYADSPRDWDGSWTLLWLPEKSRAHRDKLREELLWLGFGRISAGVLAHPTHSVAETRAKLAQLNGSEALVLLRGVDADARSNQELVKAGWDLTDLARRYEKFVASFTPIFEGAKQSASDALAPETAFLVRTLLIHEYRKIHLRDPLLPRALLPADWIGAAAYELCRDLYRLLFHRAEGYLAQLAETLTGPLEAPSRDTLRRFGGLHPNG